MKIIRLLIILTAFLLMISSALSLFSNTDRTPVYINVASMACLMIVVTLLNFKNKNNQSIDVWFGLVSKTKNGKNGKYTVYLLTDDPNNPYNHAEPILSNITSKETAVRKAIEYTKELFHNILISQKNNNKSQEDNGKKSQS